MLKLLLFLQVLVRLLSEVVYIYSTNSILVRLHHDYRSKASSLQDESYAHVFYCLSFFFIEVQSKARLKKCLQKAHKTKYTDTKVKQSKKDRLAYQIEEDLDGSSNSKGGAREANFTVAKVGEK